MMLWLPSAKRENHDRQNPWAERSDPKGVLHTTETSGWPGYGNWSVMPHATVMPTRNVGVEVHQHVSFDQAAFALRNLPGGAQTNRDYAFQFELIGTCEKGGPGYYWPGADDAVLRDLFEKVIEPLSDAFGIPLRAQPFQAYPSSYGGRSGSNNVRLSPAAWDTYSGWLGHQHVPENAHGDPGAFPWERMMEVAVALSPEDLNKIEARLNRQLVVVEQVPNLPVHEDDPKRDPFTFAGVLAYGDRKADETLELVRELTGLPAAFAELKAAFDALSAKLDPPPAP